MIQCSINQSKVELELNTGSAVTLVPENEFRKISTDLKIEVTDLRLSSFTGHSVEVIRMSQVHGETPEQAKGSSHLHLPGRRLELMWPSLDGGIGDPITVSYIS